MIIVNYPWQTN